MKGFKGRIFCAGGWGNVANAFK